MRGPRDTKAEAKGKQIWDPLRENPGFWKDGMGCHGGRGGVLRMCQGCQTAALTRSLRCAQRVGSRPCSFYVSYKGKPSLLTSLWPHFTLTYKKKALTDFLEGFPFEDGNIGMTTISEILKYHYNEGLCRRASLDQRILKLEEKLNLHENLRQK